MIWVRIRGPRLVVVSVAVILASLLPFSRCGYTRLHHIVRGHTHGPSENLESSIDPQVILAEANRLYWLNNGPKAGPLYARAEKLFADKGDARDELYARIGRLRSDAETMSFVELSGTLNELLDKPMVRNDAKLRLWCLIAKGYTDIEIDYRASKRDWLEASALAQSLGEDQWANRASGELGLIGFLEGNPGRAARMLGGALLSTMANGDEGGQIRFLELLGNGFEEVKRHSEALKFFDRAIRLAKSDKDIGIPFMAYEGKAQALAALGRTDEGRKMLLDTLAEAKSRDRHGHETQILILLGKLASQSADRGQAIEYLEAAGRTAIQRQFYSLEAEAMFELAKLYRDNGDLAAAEDRAAQGLAASQHIGDRYFVPRDLTILADLKARRGHSVEAEAMYAHAEDVIEGMLATVDEPYWNSSVTAAMSETYLQHFELLVKRGDTLGAFSVLERIRGRTLAWALKDRKAFPTSESGDTTALESDVASLQVRLMQTSSAREREPLLDELVEYERRLGLAWARTDTPTKSLLAQPVLLKRMKADMRSDEIFLEYVLNDPNSFCVSISRTGARVWMLPVGRKEVERLTQQFVGEIRAKGTGGEVSKRLFALLLQPVPETSKATRYVIAPDGVLNLLPFEALRDDHGEILLKSRVISYVPSGTILDVLRHTVKQPPAPRAFLGVGDVPYENQGGAGRKLSPPDTVRGRIERSMADLSGMSLHDLPQTRNEVESIGKLVGPDATILLGSDATETAFKKEPLDQFRVLHLAVHGFADTQYPERSALVLGTDPKSGDDGLLQVREIIRLRLNAELTTLSACDTGVGKLQGQEGVSNLVGAFLLAGSKSVVASLWSADDTFSSALMDRFYNRLAQGEDTSSALRDAKLDLLAQYGEQVSPFYWAGFIAVGETSRPIRIQQ